MGTQESEPPPQRRFGRTMALVLALFPTADRHSIIHEPLARPIPLEYILNLVERTEGEDRGFRLLSAAGNYLASENAHGRDISSEIRRLAASGIAPDLVYEQFERILTSRYPLAENELQTIAETALSWGEDFRPYFRGTADLRTREDLLNSLREHPQLRRYLQKDTDQPNTETVAERKN